jgi:SM-20-related protein
MEQAVQVLWLEEFLTVADLRAVMDFALAHEKQFEFSTVVSATERTGSVNFEYRRSRVLYDLGELGESFRDRIRRALPRVLERLGIPARTAQQIDVQMTATNDGEFFKIHTDNSTPKHRSRKLSFVYFFHREPMAFIGGELRLYNLRSFAQRPPEPRFTSITPVQNQIFFFRSELLHEITLVNCPSKVFADSRFALNGWIHW